MPNIAAAQVLSRNYLQTHCDEQIASIKGQLLAKSVIGLRATDISSCGSSEEELAST